MATKPAPKMKYALGQDVQLEIGARTIGPVGKVVGHVTWLNGTTSYVLSIVNKTSGAPEQFQVQEYEIGARFVPAPAPAPEPAKA